MDLEASSRVDDTKSLRKGAPIFLLQIANIMAWYWTNGMNGISMQSYAGKLKNEPSVNTSATPRFLDTLATTCFITCLQLLMGAWIGRLILFGLNRNMRWEQVTSTHWWPLSFLHAIGSLATNLGFMHGRASVVQLLKLVEPFETLGLSLLFFREGTANGGVLSSMVLVVGAATSLLKIQSTKTAPLAIVFAILSGLSLSARNVLQRKHHRTNDGVKELSKLECSIVQFTQLSFYSGIGMGSISAVLFVMIQPSILSPSASMILWHPLYNVFSMITLGFSSALTHSLLNAGKRVVSILMTVIWFKEGLNSKLLAGLLLVFVGGSWYSYEIKQKPNLKGKSSSYHKLVLSGAALCLLTRFHQSQPTAT
jgi:drug/metabolite transporter (DMT)-like permease